MHIFGQILVSRLEARSQLLSLFEAIHAAFISLVLLSDMLLDILRNKVTIRTMAICHTAEPVGLERSLHDCIF